uniref:Sugar transporter SWEET n=1 Tax=Elaeophora elaphi TaxID=1147741 RepID=A0A0R3S2T8_9BILA
MPALLSIFAVWLTFFSICFTFLPMLQVLNWRKRGTADGFSSINLVLPVLMMGCWLRHGYMTNDFTNIFINTVNLVVFAGYILAFAFYQPCRVNVSLFFCCVTVLIFIQFRPVCCPSRYLCLQLFALFFSLFCIFSYVSWQPDDIAADVMGTIAAAMQIISLGGQIYEIVGLFSFVEFGKKKKRAVSFGHTEFIPAELQFGIFFLATQWTIFGILMENFYIATANLAGLLVNIATISLYFIYPPLTWKVPVIGTGPQQKKVE